MLRPLASFFLVTLMALAGCDAAEEEGRRPGTSPKVPVKEPDAPVASKIAATATALAGGLSHTCALTKAKEVRCWGQGENGELGNGALVESAVPVTVSSLGDVTQIEAGESHTCALTSGGGVQCWGKNDWGQLGNRTYVNSSIPVQVEGLTSGVKQIALGSGFSCALKASDGSVACWGENKYGQIGNNLYNPTTGIPSPATVVHANLSTLTGADSITAGGSAVCVNKSGTLTCWGLNQTGQLGLGQSTGPDTCTAEILNYACAKTAYATTITQVTSLGAGLYSFCALLTDGSVKCWGDNRGQELANGATLDTCALPAGVGSSSCGLTPQYAQITAGNRLTGVTALTTGMGDGFFCATANAKTLCWGGINPENMGGMQSPIAYPTEMTLVTAGITKLDAGVYHVCGITPGDDIECWGRNAEGQFGTGDKVSHVIPKNVFGF